MILVGNNGDDATMRVATAAAELESRIRVFTEMNPGIAFALNTGLKQCTRKYCARLDADDAMPADRLELQADFLERNSDVGIVSGQVNFISQGAHGYDAYVQQINSWISHADMFKYRFVESPVAHPSVMFRRSLIEQHGPYSTADVPEDYELWLRWFEQGVQFAKISEPVLDWYDSPGRLSRTHTNYARRAFDRARMPYLIKALPALVKGRPIWVCGGKYARKKIAWLRREGILVTGVVDFMRRDLSGLESTTYDELPKPGGIYLLSMVSNRGGYKIVEQALTEKGYRETDDFLLAG
jgi:glycosyltransferase involved in cell wall biosynthesis